MTRLANTARFISRIASRLRGRLFLWRGFDLEVVDLHCDVVYKMLAHPGLSLLQPDQRLDVDVPRLRKGQVSLQVFALFVP